MESEDRSFFQNQVDSYVLIISFVHAKDGF